jgi:ABC-2 type transport system ATP-binding protein
MVERVVAEGTAKELKSKIGKDQLVLTLPSTKAMKEAINVLGKSVFDQHEDDLQVSIKLNNTSKEVRKILEQMEKAGIEIASIDIHKPTLDDVFLSLTGKSKEGVE